MPAGFMSGMLCLMTGQHYSILGGGIAGLAAAIALEKSGHAATIYEKAQAFDHVGAGIQLGPNAVRALQAIGAWDAVAPVTASPPGMDIRSAVTGKVLAHISYGVAFERRFGMPYRVAHRADLHGALLQVARSRQGITILMGQDVSATHLKGPVLGADGMWSATREALFPNSIADQLETIIYRGSIEMPETSALNLKMVNLWLYPGAHVVHYPLGRQRRLNIVAVAAAKGPKATFSGAAHELRQLLGLVPDFIPWPAAIVEPLPQWHNENIMLIGDAAHGIVPWLAQGGAMALEDAALLLETQDPIEFFKRRAPRCERLLKQTLETGEIYHMGGIKRVARDLVLRTRSQAGVLDRMAWIYQER